MNNDYCDCDECIEREEPCQFDCDADSRCIGCNEFQVYLSEVRAER